MSDLLHFLLGLLGDQALADLVIAVLGGVGDGVAHAGEAVREDQVDDQLHLVDALEVGVLRLVAGLDQRLDLSLSQHHHRLQIPHHADMGS